MFTSQDPDRIANILLKELDRVVLKLLIKVKIQKKNNQEQFWSKKLEAKAKEIEEANKRYHETNAQEDYTLLRNGKNTLLREMQKEKKKHFQKRMSLTLGKWKTLKSLTNAED